MAWPFPDLRAAATESVNKTGLLGRQLLIPVNLKQRPAPNTLLRTEEP